MKKNMYIVFAIVILILAVCMVLVNGRNDQTTVEDPAASQRTVLLEDAESTNVTVYFASEDKKYLVPVNLDINATKEVAKVALEKLIAGPASPGLAPVLPEDTKLLDVYGLGRTVVTDFTDAFTKMNEEEGALAIQAIIATVLPLTDEYTLTIMVEGHALADFYNLTEAMPFHEIYINPVEALPQESDAVAAVYYLPDAACLYLVPQTFFIPGVELPGDEQAESTAVADQDQEIARALAVGQQIIQRLLDGPAGDSSLGSVFWQDTRLLDMDLVNGVAYVDFSQDILNYGGGSANENMLLNALVYSLCGVESIDAVQLLVEGQVLEYLPEGREVSQPLSP